MPVMHTTKHILLANPKWPLAILSGLVPAKCPNTIPSLFTALSTRPSSRRTGRSFEHSKILCPLNLPIPSC